MEKLMDKLHITEEKFKRFQDRLIKRIDVKPWLDFENLPSNKSNEFNELKYSYQGRKQYIAEIGFPVLTKEFIKELASILKEKDINNFVEVDAGTGALTLALNHQDISGIAYTLQIPGEENHWGINPKSPVYKKTQELGLLNFGDVSNLKLKEVPDLTIASWIPYKGGQEVISFMESNPSQYFLLISEGRGGCVASDEFFDWLEEHYNCIWASSEYKPFDAIYDQVELYEKRS